MASSHRSKQLPFNIQLQRPQGRDPTHPPRLVLRTHQEAQRKPSKQRSPDGTHNHDRKGVTQQLTHTVSQPSVTCTETPLVNATYVFPDTEPSHFQKKRGRWMLQNCLLKSQVGHKNQKRIKSHNMCTNTLLFSLKKILPIQTILVGHLHQSRAHRAQLSNQMPIHAFTVSGECPSLSSSWSILISSLSSVGRGLCGVQLAVLISRCHEYENDLAHQLVGTQQTRESLYPCRPGPSPQNKAQ